MPDTPAMRNLGPAYARIARLDAMQKAVYDKRETEYRRIRKEGARVASVAIRRAKLVKGETLIQIGKWVMGVYEGTEINWPPNIPGKEWSFIVRVRSILKSGKPGKKIERHGIFVDHPGSVADHIKIVGRVTRGNGSSK